MSDHECPKCKTEYDVTGCPDDVGEQQCENCGFLFIVEIEYEPTYDATCVEHSYSESRRSPIFVGLLRVCEYCHHAEIRPDTTTD